MFSQGSGGSSPLIRTNSIFNLIQHWSFLEIPSMCFDTMRSRRIVKPTKCIQLNERDRVVELNHPETSYGRFLLDRLSRISPGPAAFCSLRFGVGTFVVPKSLQC